MKKLNLKKVLGLAAVPMAAIGLGGCSETVQGLAGRDGIDGADGKSAYEIWREWYTGADGANTDLTGDTVINEADFSVYLAGKKGDKGDKGEDGANGENGIDGVDGEDGADGADGTSVTLADLGVTDLDEDDDIDADDAKIYFRGERGADGADGADGVDGATGKTGATILAEGQSITINKTIEKYLDNIILTNGDKSLVLLDFGMYTSLDDISAVYGDSVLQDSFVASTSPEHPNLLFKFYVDGSMTGNLISLNFSAPWGAEEELAKWGLLYSTDCQSGGNEYEWLNGTYTIKLQGLVSANVVIEAQIDFMIVDNKIVKYTVTNTTI
jgi:hypothetical protein